MVFLLLLPRESLLVERVFEVCCNCFLWYSIWYSSTLFSKSLSAIGRNRVYIVVDPLCFCCLEGLDTYSSKSQLGLCKM